VIERVARLEEIESHWSIEDVADLNDALDATAEATAEAQKKAHSK
jgi:hypothetical protein